MTPAEYRALRDQLGLTQVELAEALGVTSNTIARRERGELAIPAEAERAIMCLVQHGPAKAG